MCTERTVIPLEANDNDDLVCASLQSDSLSFVSQPGNPGGLCEDFDVIFGPSVCTTGYPHRVYVWCGHPTTWTILQQDGPNHLGLW